jgi:dolichol-phosphate mannosyltransferase
MERPADMMGLAQSDFSPKPTSASVLANSSVAERRYVPGRNDSAVRVTLSIVIPTYNAETCLRQLCDRLLAVALSITDSFEIIFIEDRSSDNSWKVLQELLAEKPNLRAVRLSRNFGQQAAITAGLAISAGEWVCVMDCDLQDPPEQIPNFWRLAQQGNDVVFGRRLDKRQTLIRRLIGRIYFSLLSLFSMSKIEGNCGSFTLISRKVVDAYLKFSDCNRHYLMIIRWLGFNYSYVDYEQLDRFEGKSSYSIVSLVRLALQGIFFQSTVLLQLIVGLGIFLSCLSALGIFVICLNYLTHSTLPGWTSVITLVLMSSGITLTSLGIVALYIGEIFEQVKHRPLYVLAEESQSLVELTE